MLINGVKEYDRISIHPPRAGWDAISVSVGGRVAFISIHPPRAGWDFSSCYGIKEYHIFQSTHPVRGGTAPVAIH